MATVTATLNAARAELGYREGRNNDTKYGRAYGLNHAPWCAMFLWWVGHQVSPKQTLIPQIAWTPGMARWFTEQGDARWGTTPKRGAIAFFDFPDSIDRIQHVGIVEKVLPDGRVQTIEGNTSAGTAGSQADGGGVYRRVRRPRDIVLYGYPAYTREAPARPAPKPSRKDRKPLPPLVIDGVWGSKTTIGLQVLLGDQPADGVLDGDFRRDVQRWLGVKQDGVWGRVTRKALQRRVGVADDGVIGPVTIRALQRLINRST
jgi:surface antigen